MSKQQFPPGWDEKRVKALISHYENQTEDEEFAEIEASLENVSKPRDRRAQHHLKRNHMTKKPGNAGKAWAPADVQQLKQLARQNTPTRVMGVKLKRTEDAVRSKAHDEGISLKPTNQAPYGTKKRG